MVTGMTPECWHTMIDSRESGPETMVAEFAIRADSPWFSGHFPGRPILPGVAILAMAAETIRFFAGKRQQQVRIAGLKRVRFKLPVKPEDPVTVTLSRDGSGKPDAAYAFEVRVGDEIACAGVMQAEQTGIV